MRTRIDAPRSVFGFGLACAILCACARSPRLARGPIEVTATPVTVRFDQSVTSTGPTWELCFEFNRPGDSHRAAAIEAVLISATGERDALRRPELDRRGESTVCQIGVPESAASTAPKAYVAVELRSDRTVRLSGLRGG